MRHAHCSKTCRLAGGKCSPGVVTGELPQVRSLRRLTAEVRKYGEDAPVVVIGGWRCSRWKIDGVAVRAVVRAQHLRQVVTYVLAGDFWPLQ
jgi:hypothetical protein